MKYLKVFEGFKNSIKTDQRYSDRDMTNRYYTELGWIRYTEIHVDDYVRISEEFGISCSELGFILTELVEEFDLIYRCRIEDESKYNPIKKIEIDLLPSIFTEVGHSGVDFKKYLQKKGLVFPNTQSGYSHVPDSGIGGILDNIDDYLSNKGLTIKDIDGNFTFYSTSSQTGIDIYKK